MDNKCPVESVSKQRLIQLVFRLKGEFSSLYMLVKCINVDPLDYVFGLWDSTMLVDA